MPHNHLQYKDTGVYYNTTRLITQADGVQDNVTDILSTLGTVDGQLDLGTGFTGSTIPNNSTLIGALQALETAVESNAGVTFENLSKNLKSFPNTLTYDSGTGDLQTIVYNTGTGSITKTFTYTLGKLSDIVLSGDLPADLLATTKVFVYTGDNLTSISYI